MKRLTLLIALLLCLTIATLSIVGCGEKKQEPPQEKSMTEQPQEAAPDTTAVDTTATEMEEPMQQ